jgi:hypothetical protein
LRHKTAIDLCVVVMGFCRSEANMKTKFFALLGLPGLVLVGLVSPAAMLEAMGAELTVLDFSWIGNGELTGDSASWAMSSDPTPTSFITGFGTNVAVTDGVEDVAGIDSAVPDVTFWSEATGGGFTTLGVTPVDESCLPPICAGMLSPQLYTGTESAPIFSVGVYTLDLGTLTVTAAPPAVPEASTWAMMVLGFAGLGFARYCSLKVPLAVPRA